MEVTDAPVNDRVIVHSRFGMKLRYEFGPQELIYTRADLFETHRSSAQYENIGAGDPSHLALNNRLFTVVSFVIAVLVFVVTLTVIVAYQLGPWMVVIPLWVVPLTFLIIRMRTPFAYHFVLFPVSLDAFGSQGPPVWVWDDEQGQEVVDELAMRRRVRLRSLYAAVDPHNDPQREAAKFSWLRENEIIDEVEYRVALGEIEVHCSNSGAEPSIN
jgi:hypothetical protein